MPCNFIASCFHLEPIWHRHSNGPGKDPSLAQQDHWQLQELNPEPVIQQPGVAPAAEVAASSVPQPGGANTEVSPLPPNAGSKSVHNRSAKTFRAYLPECHRTYSCVHCRAHLANHDELISKSFQGSQGRAYLFNSVVNISCGQAEERVLLTGLHAVADIYCDCCKTTLGWKYEQAYESSQKYKEGKYIIELAHMIKENGWDNES